MSRAPDKSILSVARERKGLSQGDIAEGLEVTQATVSHWETGKSAPHPSAWDALAEKYGVSIAKLYEHFREAKSS